MRAILTNLGSTGDIQPLLALAAELEGHGHQAILALSPSSEAWVRQQGLAFQPIGPQLQRSLETLIASRVAMDEFTGSSMDIQRLFSPMAAALPQLFYDLQAACRGADVLISGQSQPAARMVHELTRIPYVTISLVPPGAGSTPAVEQARMALINPLRAQLGLPALYDPRTSYISSQLSLYAMSRHVVPPPSGRPSHHHTTGYFFHEDPRWQPGPELVEFIESEEPPVVVSFGSMVHDDAAALTRLVVEALGQAGRRGIIQRGWSGLAPQQLPAFCQVVEYVPHRWLFERASCVVHHGGAGTTAAALRAGVPSIFVPHAADQPLWARIVQELGCAGRPLPYAALRAHDLGAAIRETLDSPRYRQASSRLAAQIHQERGLQTASRLIEELVAGTGDELQTLALGRGEQTERLNRRQAYQLRQRSRRDAQ